MQETHGSLLFQGLIISLTHLRVAFFCMCYTGKSVSPLFNERIHLSTIYMDILHG